jgi:ParB family chromosome partitioning protein
MAFMRAKGSFPMTAIEIPVEFLDYVLIYNIEMADKIKDTCVKAHAFYLEKVSLWGEKLERELSPYLLGNPYYISLAFAHVENELASPSLVETAVKKFDTWVELPLFEALEERRRRGQMIASLAAAVNDAAINAGIEGSGAHELKKSIISKTNVALWGKKRSIEENFNDAILMMIEHINSTDWSFLGR